MMYLKGSLDRDLLLLAGWATDYRVFTPLKLPHNLLIPSYLYPPDIIEEFNEEITEPVEVMGWSMGGIVGIILAYNFPDLVSRLYLISTGLPIQRNIVTLRENLLQNPTATLIAFYRSMFVPGDTEAYVWFKDNLLRDYLANFTAEELMLCLDWFENVYIGDLCSQLRCPVRLFHGELDRIIPIQSAENLAQQLNVNLELLANTGHMPFWSGKIAI